MKQKILKAFATILLSGAVMASAFAVPVTTMAELIPIEDTHDYSVADTLIGTSTEIDNGHNDDGSPAWCTYQYGDLYYTYDYNHEILTVEPSAEIKAAGKTTIIPDGRNYAVFPWNAYRFRCQEVVIGDGITVVGSNAFTMMNLTSVELPAGLKEVHESAFEGCVASHIDLPEGLQVIEHGAFWHALLTSLILPESLTKLDRGAFDDSVFPEVTIPAGVQELALQVFAPNTILYVTKGSPAHNRVIDCGEDFEYGNPYSTGVLEDCVVTMAESAAYTGQPVTPQIYVQFPMYFRMKNWMGTFEDTRMLNLVEGVDYEVSYSNNVEKGTATATITGIGHYHGTITKPFTITNSEDAAPEPEKPQERKYFPIESWNGVYSENDDYYLVDGNGNPRTGLFYLDNFFDGNGGFGIWVYTDENGKMQDGDVVINGRTYHIEYANLGIPKNQITDDIRESAIPLNDKGGIDGDDPVPKEGGVVTKEGWKYESGNWYWYAANERQGGWKLIGGVWYYMNPSTKAMMTGWQKINGVWYYLKASGAMAANEWCEGYWLSGDGAWTYPHYGQWHLDANGWWFGDTSGWYARSATYRIDNADYYFNASGYWAG